jgi:acetyltransferase-like isoleucine patch superfamily enzyme
MEGVSRYLNHVFTPEIIIEDNVTIEQNLHLTCANFIKIGRDTAIASNVSITDIIHPYEDIALPIDKQDIKTRDVIIGNSCKIYNNAIILPGTELGNHCVVGANTVLIGKKYRDFSVMVGNPSKVVKRYCTQVGKWKRTNFDGDFLD